VNGCLSKSTLQKREDYTHVIDFHLLLNDYLDNNISERSFVCIDKAFFRNNFNLSDRLGSDNLAAAEVALLKSEEE
jgi:hypothetical protein